MNYTQTFVLLAAGLLLLYGCAGAGANAQAKAAPAGGTGQVGNAPPQTGNGDADGAPTFQQGALGPSENDTQLAEGSDGEGYTELPLDDGSGLQ